MENGDHPLFPRGDTKVSTILRERPKESGEGGA